jgi:hypothetical protein
LSAGVIAIARSTSAANCADSGVRLGMILASRSLGVFDLSFSIRFPVPHGANIMR